MHHPSHHLWYDQPINTRRSIQVMKLLIYGVTKKNGAWQLVYLTWKSKKLQTSIKQPSFILKYFTVTVSQLPLCWALTDCSNQSFNEPLYKWIQVL